MFDKDATRVGSKRSRTAFLLVAVVALLASSAFVGTSYAHFNTTKYFRVTVAPAGANPVGAGTSTAYAVTVYNDSSSTLGSANITAPTGWTVTGAAPSPKATAVGNTVQLRNLSLGSNKSAVFTINATAPCTAATGNWAAAAQTTSLFNGNSSTNFTLKTANSVLTAAATGSCHLNFVTQPADAQKNTAIATTAFNDPPGTSIQVEIAATDNTRVTVSTAPVLVALSPSSPDAGAGAVLAGTLSKNAVAGVASFADLAINVHGVYALDATSTGLTPATSGSFQIWDAATKCATGTSCASSAAVPGSLSASFSATSSTGGVLALSVGEATLNCGDSFRHAPLEVTATTFNFTATNYKTMVSIIDKSFVQSPRPAGTLPFFWVCFQADKAFKYGWPLNVTVPANTSYLLPACLISLGTAPCVQSIDLLSNGDVKETLKLPKDDAFRYR